MPGKSKGSIAVAEVMPPARKPRARTIKMSAHVSEPHDRISDMLREIKIRGDQLRSEIKELLVRLS